MSTLTITIEGEPDEITAICRDITTGDLEACFTQIKYLDSQDKTVNFSSAESPLDDGNWEMEGYIE